MRSIFDLGRARIAQVDAALAPERWQFERPYQKNLFLYDASTVIAQLLRRDPEGKSWHLSTAYIEFENNGGAAVTVPTPTRGEGLSYYDGLASSPTRDYLRVPVVATQLSSTDEDLFPDGNLITFFFHTAGDEGVNGKVFSSAQQSRVYGAALVSTPVPEDSSQDKVFSRVYYSSAADQYIKAATTQIGLEYQLPFV